MLGGGAAIAAGIQRDQSRMHRVSAGARSRDEGLIARFLFYDVRHATIAGTDKDHRFVVLDQELMRIRLRHFLDNLGRQWLQFDVQRHSVADSVARRPLPKPYTIRKGARTKG